MERGRDVNWSWSLVHLAVHLGAAHGAIRAGTSSRKSAANKLTPPGKCPHMKEKDSQMDAPPDKIQELTPFTHRVMGGTYKIAVESQGKNPGGTDRGKRYYFNHPWKKDKNGRALKIHSQSADIIKSLLEAAVKDAFRRLGHTDAGRVCGVRRRPQAQVSARATIGRH